MIENRNLSVGTRLVATYKKQVYVCTVQGSEDGERNEFVLEDGNRFKSPSAAASHVMGGGAINGWRFWSLEGDAPATTAEVKPTAIREKNSKTIRRVPNQQGVPEGQVRMHCSACQKGFVTEAGVEPVCPEGHSNAEALAS